MKNNSKTEEKQTDDFVSWPFLSEIDTIVNEDLKVDKMTPDEVRESLSKVSGLFAFWSINLATVQKHISEYELKYDLWYAKTYLEVDKEDPKRTEGYKKNTIYLNNQAFIKKYHTRLYHLFEIREKVSSIVKSLEMQSRTLQTVASLFRAEFKMISGAGSGSLDNID